MKNAWISVAGLLAHYPDLFEDLVLPVAADVTGDEFVSPPWVPDRDDLRNYICWQLAELPLVYSDPDTLKALIAIWAKTNYKPWKDLLRTLNYKYNPLWNKDGTIRERRDITYEKDGSSSDTGIVVTDNDTTSTGTVGRSGSSSGSTEHQVTGFDTNTYSPDVKDITSSSASETTTNNLAGTDDTTVTNNLAGTTAEDGSSTDIFERTEQGNIGVTTTTQLIREQRELVQFNFYDYICQSFKREFCVMVW